MLYAVDSTLCTLEKQPVLWTVRYMLLKVPSALLFKTGQERLLAYPPPTDPDTLAPAVSESAIHVSCSPPLLFLKTRVF